MGEFSVVYTERALNLMSTPFQETYRDISASLKRVYNADGFALIPGSGTFAMESVARQFVSKNTKALIVRNGWFSYRWTQIIESGRLTEVEPIVCLAEAVNPGDVRTGYRPHAVEKVIERIRSERPSVIFAPHVETATGIMLPDEYLMKIGEAAKEVNAMFVLDCIASG